MATQNDVPMVVDEDEDANASMLGHCKSFNLIFNILPSDVDKRKREATCKSCGHKYKYFKIRDAIAHVRKCRECDREVADKCLEEYELYRSRRVTRSNEKARTSEGALKADCDDLVVEIVALGMHSFRMVEHEPFKRFAKRLNPYYTLPHRSTLRNTLVPVRADAIKAESKRSFNNAPDFSLTVEFDCWTSVSHLSLLAVTITTRQGTSFLGGLIDVGDESHTAEYLAGQVEKCLRSLQLPHKKIGTIMSDEASNCKKARDLLVTNHYSRAIDIRCIAHLFNLVTMAASRHPAIKTVLDKLLRIINIFEKQRAINAFLRQEGALRLIHAAPTRWHTTTYCIKSILRIWDTIEAIPKTEEYSYGRWGRMINSELRDSLQRLSPYFEFVSDMVKLAEASGTGLGESVHKAFEFVQMLTTGAHPNTTYRCIFIDAILTHLKRSNFMLLISAYYLDPNHRGKWVTKDGVDLVKNYVIAKLINLGLVSENRVGTAKTITVYSEFDNYILDLKTLAPGTKVDINGFWASSNYILLKEVGIRLSNIHPSSANTERFFSAMNRIMTKSRSRMDTNTLFELMLIRTNALSKYDQSTSVKQRPFGESADGPLLQEADTGFDPVDMAMIEGGPESKVKYAEFKRYIDFKISLDYIDKANTPANNPSTSGHKRDVAAAKALMTMTERELGRESQLPMDVEDEEWTQALEADDSDTEVED